MILTIAIAAAIGAIIRYLLSSLNRDLPWGTLAANNLAVFAIPVILNFPIDLSDALIIGFAGSLSTVSTFALEMHNFSFAMKLRYATLTLITCLASFEIASYLF
jgi:fluoride ion exporter CrcB/FEX